MALRPGCQRCTRPPYRPKVKKEAGAEEDEESARQRRAVAPDAPRAQPWPLSAQLAPQPAPPVTPQLLQVVGGSPLHLRYVWLGGAQPVEVPWPGYKPAYAAPELPAGGAEGAARPHAVACAI
jgi:hypothetical protein